MSNDAELRRKIAEGERANQLLNDPMLVAALKEMRETVYENIRSSHFRHKDEREYLYLQLRAIDEFEKRFKHRMQNGHVAASRLDELKRTMKRVIGV
jgi:hypothetical protein